LILNKTGGKLSKRQGDVFVEDYRQKGYLPEAIINFSALLGWHSKDDQEIYTLAELEKVFDIKGLGASPAVFDLDKLDFYNGYYIRQKSVADLSQLCRPYLDAKVNDDQLDKAVTISQDRLKKLSDIKELTDFLFSDQLEYDSQLLIWKALSLDEVKNNLKEIEGLLASISAEFWTREMLEKTILEWIKANDKKVGDYLWPLRVSLTGLKNSPGPFEVAWALGKEQTQERIKLALTK